MITTFDTGKGRFLTRIYTYGLLEEKCGYDLVSCLDDSLYEDINSTTSTKDIETSLVHNGEEIPVIMVLWVEPRFNSILGMVIDKEDVTSYAIAKERQLNKVLAIDC